ncbi:MAG: hypothetical protein ACFB0D_17070 [Phormidesmis sp.]
MKLLLDTQCWLWWFAQPEKLNAGVMNILQMNLMSYGSLWLVFGKSALKSLLASYRYQSQ